MPDCCKTSESALVIPLVTSGVVCALLWARTEFFASDPDEHRRITASVLVPGERVSAKELLLCHLQLTSNVYTDSILFRHLRPGFYNVGWKTSQDERKR